MHIACIAHHLQLHAAPGGACKLRDRASGGPRNKTDCRGSLWLRTRARSAERQHPGFGDTGGGRAEVHHLQGPEPDALRPGSGGVSCAKIKLGAAVSRWS
jgi:hypothetical protein